jgi:L-asparaginase/Glu-tRNA(Gln) amidotransferase subunit D
MAYTASALSFMLESLGMIVRTIDLYVSNTHTLCLCVLFTVWQQQRYIYIYIDINKYIYIYIDLGKLVVIAGAMIPLHFPHSDARRNLIMSVLCAASLDIPEVCIYSNDKLLRGNRTTKIANMAVDAFQSPNHPILASTGVETTIEDSLILPFPRRRYI